jgi:hypothetical protein
MGLTWKSVPPDTRHLNKKCKPGCKTQQRWTEKKIEDRGRESLGDSRKDDGGHPRMLRTCDRAKDTYERSKSSWAVRVNRRKIILIEGNAQCRHLKRLTYKGTLRQVCIVCHCSCDRTVSKSNSCWLNLLKSLSITMGYYKGRTANNFRKIADLQNLLD